MKSVKKLRGSIYQIKATLDGSKPPIWRRLQVSGDITLNKLHRIIQVAMGWSDYHLHQFIIDEEYYGELHPDYGSEMKDEKKVKLLNVASQGDKFAYEYDFGDSWLHVILVEKILHPEPGIDYPRLLKGKRACPPEDVGGVWGYEELLEAIRDPGHREHREMLEWVGGEFDPEKLDKGEINQALRKIR